MHPSGLVDGFARENLPPVESWPELLFELPELRFPARLNSVSVLLDAWLARGHGDAPCVVGVDGVQSYAAFAGEVSRIAGVLVRQLGMVSGERVLLRGPNNGRMLACILAVMKAGGVAVPTMPMLRAGELRYPLEKARVRIALCDARLAGDLEAARTEGLEHIVLFGGGDLEARMALEPDVFDACDTASDDVALIGFTSGTTGVPKGTMHFHRDILAICETYARHVLRPVASDRFIGSPPMAFTFGLGGLALFPLWAGASTVLLERAGPDELLAAIPQYRPTIVFTAPTAYRVMLGKLEGVDISSLRACVSAGETLPPATYEAWKSATGISLMDGIGATEMLHIFIAARAEDTRPGFTGRPIPGVRAAVLDAEGNELPDGVPGRLAVKGPVGCRYLADERQGKYVQGGWNITGDTYVRDADGYYKFLARSDDMIVSAGYNIAGPEVEAALLLHPAVAECAVVGVPDAARGAVVKAFVVLRGAASVEELQNHVKATIAPYKYPRAVEFVAELPKTQTGKLQRFRLREGK
jgi:2-aminobenzoate-CoA ligase